MKAESPQVSSIKKLHDAAESKSPKDFGSRNVDKRLLGRLAAVATAFVVVTIFWLSIANPLKSPLEEEGVTLSKVFKAAELNASSKALLLEINKLSVEASHGPYESRILSMEGVLARGSSAASKFVEKNPWVWDSSASSGFDVQVQEASSKSMEKLITKYFPSLSQDWKAHQVDQLSSQFLEYALSQDSVSSVVYQTTQRILKRYDDARLQVRDLRASNSRNTSGDICVTVKTEIVSVQEALSSDLGISETSLRLKTASSLWDKASSHFTGSKSDWLKKMAELALAVKDYVVTGQPVDGPLKATQLQNNMKIYSVFCK